MKNWLPVGTAVLLAAFCTGQAATFSEDFSSAPLPHGWRVFGNSSLFAWNSASQNLSVTWDSSQTNSYFYLPLGTLLDRFDDFSFALDLTLSDVTGGVNPSKPFTFELALGFLNLVNSTQTNFFRGNGRASPNLVEFDYFPPANGISGTVWPSLWSTNSVLNYNGPNDYTIMDLPIGVPMHLTMSYTASNATLVTTLATNGVPIGPVNSVPLSATFTDFGTGAFALMSYSDAGQDPRDSGSLLAHGTVDNIQITIPPLPILNLKGALTNHQWQVTFTSRSNWVYTLERALDLKSWTPASPTLPGVVGNLTLVDTNPAAGPGASYRVRAERP